MSALSSVNSYAVPPFRALILNLSLPLTLTILIKRLYYSGPEPKSTILAIVTLWPTRGSDDGDVAFVGPQNSIAFSLPSRPTSSLRLHFFILLCLKPIPFVGSGTRGRRGDFFPAPPSHNTHTTV